MIEIKNLTKQYGKKESTFVALKDINLKIEDGSRVAIIGKSGSGKSTLMHIISGLDHPTSGSVMIDGQELAKMKPRQIDNFRAQQMGFIFQAFFVEANQTCYQNVLLALEISKVPGKKRDELIKDALDKVELSEKVDVMAKNLSGGQKQRLAIARAIVNKPKLIFADEPTGNLDSVTGDKIIKLLFKLNQTIGSTLIIVTHDPELANQCQKEIHLKDGQIIQIKKVA
jgi:putative ABC transport system ATP-binding protein